VHKLVGWTAPCLPVDRFFRIKTSDYPFMEPFRAISVQRARTRRVRRFASAPRPRVGAKVLQGVGVQRVLFGATRDRVRAVGDGWET